eukprot:Tamp_11364.p1 GENE.Tamp_11364~~Tamp_11364.p1  ORF type:complete len:561 (-),score=134.89 Tamp_11364:244-1833(-)
MAFVGAPLAVLWPHTPSPAREHAPAAPRGCGHGGRARWAGALGAIASPGVLPAKDGDMGAQQLEEFLDVFRESVAAETFVKGTLSQNKGEDRSLTNVYMRLVSLKAGASLQVKLRHKTNDVTKNFPVADAEGAVRELLLAGFRQAYLFTSTGDWQLKLGKKSWLRRVGKGPTFETAGVQSHDRVKSVAVNTDSHYLRLLGITNAKGEARPGKKDKLKQIQQFVSVVSRAVDDSKLAAEVRAQGRALRMVDMGCGKGYLTFAAHCHLSDVCAIPVRTQGVELRQQLVDDTNGWSEELGIAPTGEASSAAGQADETGLSFVQGYISDALARIPGTEGPTDVLVALHACDTATDDAIRAGINAGARVIIVAPCCHKELRGQMDGARGQRAGGVLQDVFAHGILTGRTAEVTTDALRALLLEIMGYRTQVFEFIDGVHTAKNVMITAIRREKPLGQKQQQELRQRLAALMAFYGVGVQRLAMHMGENPESQDPRYLMQKTTLQHSIDLREAMTDGAQAVPGKRPRTAGSDVTL